MLDGSWRVHFQHQLIARAPATEIADLIRAKRRRKGVRGADDAVFVNAASAPPKSLPEPSANARAALPTRTARRAGPGGAIGATRLA